MSTFKSISDTNVASGAAISQSTMQALKDNISATFEGNLTAPQIKPQAFDTHQSDGQPDANDAEANYIIASVTGHTNTTKNVCRIDIRSTGNYLLCYDARLGESTFTGSSSGNLTEARAEFVLTKASSGSESYSDISGTSGAIDLDTLGDDDGRAPSLHIVKDINLTAGDKIKLSVTEQTTPIECSVTFYVAVKDKRTMCSRDAIGVMP